MAVDAGAEALKGNPPSRKASPDVKTLGDESEGQRKMSERAVGQPDSSGVLERLKNQKVSRRKLLAGAASLVAGVAAGEVLRRTAMGGASKAENVLADAQASGAVEKGVLPVIQESTESFRMSVANWIIEADESIPLNSRSETFNRTVEEDMRIIQSTIDSLPKVGNLRFVLTNSDRPSIDNTEENSAVYISRNASAETIKEQIGHEVAHLWDPDANYKYLPKLVSAEDLKLLRAEREKVLSDPTFSPNVPSMERIFLREKGTGVWALDRKYTPPQMADLVAVYADLYWLMQGPSAEINISRFLFEPHIKDALDEVKRFSKEPGIVNYWSVGEFIEGQKLRFDALSRQNPIFGKAVEIIKQKQHLFTFENTLWASGRFEGVGFHGKYLADWWRGVPFLVNGVLAEGIMNNDPEIVALFPADVAKQIKINLENLKGATELERFAQMGMATMMYKAETPFTAYFGLMKLIASKAK